MPEGNGKNEVRNRPFKWAVRLFKWAGVVIAGALIVSFFTDYGPRWLWGEFKQRASEAQNISSEQALAIAKLKVGADTVDAIPFRNKDSDLQYIAVSTKTPTEIGRFPSTPDMWTIHLLEGKGAADTYREPEPTGMEAYDRFSGINSQGAPISKEKYLKTVFSVVDIGGDGDKEIFSIVREGGSGAYGFTIYVYDSMNKDLHWLRAAGSYASPTLGHEYSPNASRDKEIYDWMNQKALELTFKTGPSTTDDGQKTYKGAVQSWQENNGTGFYEGALIIEKSPGEIPDLISSVACSLDDGEFQWTSAFKGALFAYDKAEDVYFVVYVPYSQYDWVASMISGERYLWLGIGTEEGVLAFDKVSESLKIMPVPELSGLVGEYAGPSERVYPRRFSEGLRVSESSLFAGDTRLTLPGYVNAESEFENATVCSGW